MSGAFARFHYAFFEDPYSARDYLDVDTLYVLDEDDRKRAEQALLDFLPDLRAVIGLGHLRSKRALPVIRSLFTAPAPLDCRSRDVEIVKALHSIEPARDYSFFLSGVLKHSRDWLTRMEAAIALAEMPGVSTMEALVFALDDRDRLVRHHAASTLLKLHGLAAETNDPQDAVCRIMSDDAARRKEAKRDVLHAIEGREMDRPSR